MRGWKGAEDSVYHKGPWFRKVGETLHCGRLTRNKLLSKWAVVVEVVRININLEEPVALYLDSWERHRKALKKRIV